MTYALPAASTPPQRNDRTDRIAPSLGEREQRHDIHRGSIFDPSHASDRHALAAAASSPACPVDANQREARDIDLACRGVEPQGAVARSSVTPQWQGETLVSARSPSTRPGSVAALLATAAALAACTVAPPAGPSIAALPPANKPFEVFQQEDLQCREYGAQASGGVPAAQAASANATNAPFAGTFIGAAVGAAIGAAAGNPALGAAIGGGAGLLFGSASGAGQAGYSGLALQQLYDVAYAQCMAAHGNAVPPPGSPAYAAFGSPYFYPYYPFFPYYGPWGPWGWGGGGVFIGGRFGGYHH
jgi:hypothetical protein